MKKTSPKVVFFGSGPVAARSLELLEPDFDIEAVITKPKPAHHKHDFPVLTVAENHGLTIHPVTDKKTLSDLFAGAAFESQVAVLVDFGIIVTQDVIDYFPRGIVNSHFSLLPEWRGADPITFAVLSGQQSTGVSLMLVVEALDEGPLISFGEYALPPRITTPELTDRLINLSHQMLRAELPRYLANPDFKPSPQSITGRPVSYSRKLTKADGLIDWSKSTVELDREIRAFLGWPGSRTRLAGKDVVVTKARPSKSPAGLPGTVTVDGKRLLVACGDGTSLEILELKPAGKQKMTAESFINGHKLLLS